MSGQELLQVAEERSLAGKCGNPLCPHPFSWQQRPKVFRVTGEAISKQDGDCYCSKACDSFMNQLAKQLGNPMDRLSPGVLDRLSQPSHGARHRPLGGDAGGGVAAQGGGVTTMLAEVQVRTQASQYMAQWYKLVCPCAIKQCTASLSAGVRCITCMVRTAEAPGLQLSSAACVTLTQDGFVSPYRSVCLSR